MNGATKATRSVYKGVAHLSQPYGVEHDGTTPKAPQYLVDWPAEIMGGEKE